MEYNCDDCDLDCSVIMDGICVKSLINECKELQAELKKKDELLFAYESVHAPVNPLQAQNQKLQEYAAHKDKCPAKRMFFIPECPHCGSRKGHWRSGVHFEHERMCESCNGPAWEPEKRRGECNCGLDELKESTDAD